MRHFKTEGKRNEHMKENEEAYEQFLKEVTLDFSKEFVRDNLYYRLVGREENSALLQEIPHRNYLNLALVYYWRVYEETEQIGSILMTRGQMEHYQWTEEELWRYAKINTPRLFPAEIRGIREVLGDLFLQDEELPMLILSNNRGVNGASCILYQGVLEELAEKLREDYYVLPSSVHEVIAVPDRQASQEQLYEMVCSINRTHLSKEEVLSDAVYFYSREAKELTLVGLYPEKKAG